MVFLIKQGEIMISQDFIYLKKIKIESKKFISQVKPKI
jgi:hypothetical protein